MCGSMVDMQSATAENRRGKKKKDRRKKPQGGHNYPFLRGINRVRNYGP